MSPPTPPSLPTGILTGGLFTSGIKIIWALITLFVIICVLAAIYYILIGGINLITSRGHKENIANNRDAIIYALIGIFLVFLCFVIIEIFGSILGVNLLSFLNR
jgi:predicted small integral membrane protein